LRRKREAELSDELRFHVEHQTAEYIAEGMPPEDADGLLCLNSAAWNKPGRSAGI